MTNRYTAFRTGIRESDVYTEYSEGMQWKPLRKGTTKLKVERQHGTATVLAENVRFRVDDDARMLDLSVDLTVSAADRLIDFKSLTIDDRVIIDHLAKVLKHVRFGVPDV